MTAYFKTGGTVLSCTWLLPIHFSPSTECASPEAAARMPGVQAATDARMLPPSSNSALRSSAQHLPPQPHLSSLAADSIQERLPPSRCSHTAQRSASRLRRTCPAPAARLTAYKNSCGGCCPVTALTQRSAAQCSAPSLMRACPAAAARPRGQPVLRCPPAPPPRPMQSCAARGA